MRLLRDKITDQGFFDYMRVMVKDQAAVIQDAKGLRVFIHRQQERVREYIAEQLEKETQSDIKRAMTMGTNKIGDLVKIIKLDQDWSVPQKQYLISL